MSTSKEFIDYLSEQLRDVSEIKVKPMMGEYLLYYRDKLIGDICDNRLLVKPVNAAKSLLPDAEMQLPYSGAKPMLLIENLDDGDFLLSLFEAMYPELPDPKPRKKK